MRVLVIEDAEDLAAIVAAGLRDARMAIDVALDGKAGLERAPVHEYEVVVLDRDLPAVHGDEVCRRLVAAGARSRVLMLTGADQDQDLVDGLGLGAHDYLPKPFAFAVLSRGSQHWRGGRNRASPVSTHLCSHPRHAPRRQAVAPEFGCSSCCSAPRAGSCPPMSCSNASGTRLRTRSRARSRSRSAACGPGSATRPVIATVAKAAYRI